MYNNILVSKPTYPKNMDKITRDLVSKILTKEPEVRMTLSDIQKHQFFDGLNWDDAITKKLMPPFIPDLDDDCSLQYFKNDNKMQM